MSELGGQSAGMYHPTLREAVVAAARPIVTGSSPGRHRVATGLPQGVVWAGSLAGLHKLCSHAISPGIGDSVQKVLSCGGSRLNGSATRLVRKLPIDRSGRQHGLNRWAADGSLCSLRRAAFYWCVETLFRSVRGRGHRVTG